jgi:hypothetical protein
MRAVVWAGPRLPAIGRRERRQRAPRHNASQFFGFPIVLTQKKNGRSR